MIEIHSKHVWELNFSEQKEILMNKQEYLGIVHQKEGKWFFSSSYRSCSVFDKWVTEILQIQSCPHPLISYRIFANVTNLSQVLGALLMAPWWTETMFPRLCVDHHRASRFREYLKTDHSVRLLCKLVWVLNYFLCIPCLKRKGKLSVNRTSYLFHGKHEMCNVSCQC